MGHKTSTKTKEKISLATSGKNHYNWRGYYITPKGVFESSADAANSVSVGQSAIIRWCRTKNTNTISAPSESQVPYLSKSDIGKTFADIGFGFIPKD